MFLYTEEFTVRVDDIVKVVPAGGEKTGTYVYVRSHSAPGCGVDREYTKSNYKVVQRLVFAISELNT